ncbi:hypothetical protein MPSEU_000066300 [Mayamaea pseudoterrestris]|nr:hypothetical protein MPSEU_000066300 [Mayamaea pseudoterrestris]
MAKQSLIKLLLLVLLAGSVAPFSPLALSSRTCDSHSSTALQASSRRQLLTTAASAIVLGSLPLVALANVDELAMPTADEQASADAAAMAERIRRKRELQKKASSPVKFTDKFSKEQEKQKELKSQTQEERRNALCEELGRGC